MEGGRLGDLASGCLVVGVFLVDAGSLPRIMGSLYRNWWGVVYPRYGRSFRPVALCMAELEPFYFPSDSSRYIYTR